MGRLWQSLILQNWQQIFAWLPIETLVHENQTSLWMKGLKTNLTYPPASTDAHEAGLS
jgi:hypothetical protein